MTVFLAGGSKSGKSSLAQKIAVHISGEGPLYYLATMIPTDREDQDRIRTHRLNRAGLGFQTLEHGCNLQSVIPGLPHGATVLLDSVTALLTNELYRQERNWVPDPDARSRCIRDLFALMDAVSSTVIVSDLVFSDSQHYGEETEQFRKDLGAISCAIAARADVVLEPSIGLCRIHRLSTSLPPEDRDALSYLLDCKGEPW